MSTCPICGGPMADVRVTCSQPCSAVRTAKLQEVKNAAKRQRRIEDVEWLLGGGERPELIPGRLGMSRLGLVRSLEHEHRDDLVDVLMGRCRP